MANLLMYHLRQFEYEFIMTLKHLEQIWQTKYIVAYGFRSN